MLKTLCLQQEGTHFRVLQLILDNPQVIKRELAARLGVPLRTTNYILRTLMQKGVIETQNFQANRQKLRCVYLLTPQGLIEKVARNGSLLALKRGEHKLLKPEIEAVSRDANTGRFTMSNAIGK